MPLEHTKVFCIHCSMETSCLQISESKNVNIEDGMISVLSINLINVRVKVTFTIISLPVARTGSSLKKGGKSYIIF